MSISNVRDPRDSLPDILHPSANIFAVEETAYIQRELGDDGFRVFFNTERLRYVIQDTKAPGGPAASYAMIVQNPDGSPRNIDNRTVETLRKMLGQGHKAAAEDLIRAEIERDRSGKSRRESMSAAFADDFKWFGRAVTPSVGWRDRSTKREQIRKEKQS